MEETLTSEVSTITPSGNVTAPVQFPSSPLIRPETKTETLLPASANTGIDPQCGCNGGAGAPTGYIFAIGNIVPRFPSKSLEEEYNYAYQEFKAEGPPSALYYQVLSQGQNLYIARQMCWVLQIDGVETYIIVPRTDVELYQIIASLNPDDLGKIRFDVMVGVRGALAPPSMCNGLQLPMVSSNLSYHFTFDQFVLHVQGSIPGIPADVVSSMLQQMLQVADNAGETDAHRAINYLTTRSKDIYYLAWMMQEPSPPSPYPPGTYFLNSVSAKPSSVQGNRNIVDVIFQYNARDSYNIQYWYIKVDVTGMYPFLASKQLMQYYPAP